MMMDACRPQHWTKHGRTCDTDATGSKTGIEAAAAVNLPEPEADRIQVSTLVPAVLHFDKWRSLRPWTPVPLRREAAGAVKRLG